MTDAEIKALDDCASAVQGALSDCAETRTIDCDIDLDLSDPAVRLAIEAQCFVQAWRKLRGRAIGRTYYA